MALFKNKKTIQLNPRPISIAEHKKSQIPDDFLKKCPECHRGLLQTQIKEDYLCPHCSAHLQFPARERINWLVDEGSFNEIAKDLGMRNPLHFPDYEQKIQSAQQLTSEDEAVLVGKATFNGIPIALGVMDNRFMMASMGTVVGEKLTQLFELATENKLPVILYIASGGARMQEGILSLMQMAKVSQAVRKHHEAGLFYLAILTHPTTGGVTASFAMQADIILAEPKAVIGFAGKRVIEQTIKATLPDDFQSAETVQEYGFVDHVVSRTKQKNVLNLLLKTHIKVGD